MFAFRSSLSLLIFFYFYSLTLAVSPIADLNANDPAYTAVKSALGKGYFTLYNNRTFQGNRAISRKEMAILITRLNQDKKEAKLAPSTISSLSNLSQTFKPLLSGVQSDYSKLQSKFFELQEENKSLHHDFSKLQEDNSILNKTVKEQRWWIYGTLAISTLSLLTK
eukprot:COSAG01_NODE_519_length_16012_cov_4.344058_5_plen_166_part_00